MVGHDGLVRGYSGQHRFSAAGKTGEQVRLNEALRKDQVRLGCGSIDNALAPGGKGADFDHCGIVSGDMHDNLFVLDDLLPVFVYQLLARGGAMKACGDQNLYICIRLRGTNPPEQDRRDDVTVRDGCGPS